VEKEEQSTGARALEEGVCGSARPVKRGVSDERAGSSATHAYNGQRKKRCHCLMAGYHEAKKGSGR